jgi:transcriptional regulator with XRE-family HTH domain
VRWLDTALLGRGSTRPPLLAVAVEAAQSLRHELAKKVRTTQSAIARLEDAEYAGHSLTMLERIATACGVALKLHAQKKPNFDREVALG